MSKQMVSIVNEREKKRKKRVINKKEKLEVWLHVIISKNYVI